MNKVRIGVVGCGVMGTRHVESAINVPRAEPVAVADLIESKAHKLADQFEVPAVYASAEALIADANVDAVIVAFPAIGRAAVAVKALEAGKHVLVEKPVAMNADEVRRMIAARGDRVAGSCSLRFRYFEHAKRATEFLATDALGDLRLLRARQLGACGPAPESPRPAWRLTRALNGGGILFNWGCYDIDYLMGLTGWTLKPRTVFAQAWPIPRQFASHVAPGSDAETYYTALVRCDGGTIISLERGEFMPAANDEAWQIIGEKGSLRMCMTPAEGKTLTHDDTSTADGVQSRVLWTGDEDWKGPHSDAPVADLVEAILEGRQTETHLERSLMVQQISDAIIASAATGRCIDID
jgi:predicted dehydrogenase